MTIIEFKSQRAGQKRFPVYFQSDFVGYLWLTGYEQGQLHRGHSLNYEVGKLHGLYGTKHETLFKQGKLNLAGMNNKVLFQLMPKPTRSGKERVRILATRPLWDLPLSDRLYFSDRIMERKYQ